MGFLRHLCPSHVHSAGSLGSKFQRAYESLVGSGSTSKSLLQHCKEAAAKRQGGTPRLSGIHPVHKVSIIPRGVGRSATPCKHATEDPLFAGAPGLRKPPRRSQWWTCRGGVDLRLRGSRPARPTIFNEQLKSPPKWSRAMAWPRR